MSKSEWKVIAKTEAGREYGHCAGHQYHDVHVKIGQRGKRYRVAITEVWGTSQGWGGRNLEEHGRKQAVALGDSIDEAVRTGRTRAAAAGIDAGYLRKALDEAHADAVSGQ